LSQVFFLPWYFSSWVSGESRHSGFKSQLVALSLWCVMFLVCQFYVGNLLRVVLVLFPDIFVNFCLQFRWPQWLLVWQSILCFTFSEFLYIDFYTLISFQLPFVLHSYLMVLLHQSISRFCPSCFWLLCQAYYYYYYYYYYYCCCYKLENRVLHTTNCLEPVLWIKNLKLKGKPW
jgi:hypothetical protein